MLQNGPKTIVKMFLIMHCILFSFFSCHF